MRRLSYFLLWAFALIGVAASFLGTLVSTGVLPPLYKTYLHRVAPEDIIPMAILNTDRVKEEAFAFKRLREYVEAQTKVLHEDFLAQETELRAESEEIKKKEAVQSAPSVELQEHKLAFQKRVAEFGQQIQQKREVLDAEEQKAYTEIEEQFKSIVDETALHHGARIVIDTRPVLYAESVDVTDEVIQRLDYVLQGFHLPKDK